MTQNSDTISNGPGAAAILSAGLGCFLVGFFSLFAAVYPPASKFFTFYPSVGDISGITASAVVIWLVAWHILFKVWHNKTVQMGWVNLLAFIMLILGLLLTFPPFGIYFFNSLI